MGHMYDACQLTRLVIYTVCSRGSFLHIVEDFVINDILNSAILLVGVGGLTYVMPDISAKLKCGRVCLFCNIV